MPEHDEPDNKEQRAVEKRPDAGQVDTVSQTAHSNSSNQQSEKRKPLSRYELWQVGLAVVGAVLGGLGLYILERQNKLLSRQTDLMGKQTELLGRQTKLMNQQVIETEKASKQTDEQSRLSFKASTAQSKAALDQSIEALRLDQRAWVGPVSIEPGPGSVYVKEGESPNFHVVLANSGKTIARKFIAQLSMRVLKAGDEFSPMYERPAEPPSVNILQPGMRTMMQAPKIPVSMTKIDIERLGGGTHRLYAYGKMFYEDIFKRSHSTTFCMFLSRDLRSFTMCNVYNEAD